MQKHTIKLLLRTTKKNKLGQHPIYIRITIERKSSYISTSYYINKSLWDQKNERVKDLHPLAESINLDITNKKKEALDNLINASVRKVGITAADVKSQTVMGVERTCIFSFADRHRGELAGKRAEGTTDNWEIHLGKLEDFNGSRELDFNLITKEYLTAFENYLRGDSVERINGRNPNNYIGAIMITIRTLFNAARKSKLITCYPFDFYEIPKRTPGKKQRLTLEELDRLEQFVNETKTPRFKVVGVWFLFGCYTGLRVSDWHQFNAGEYVHNNYISIETIKNKERVAMPIHDRLKRTLAQVKVTPLHKKRDLINKILKDMAKEMKIKKSLSSHSARHTFAITMCAERGISAETCAKLMGITVNVCVQNYYRVTPAKIKNETSLAWEGI